jgi:hypothetical protein
MRLISSWMWAVLAVGIVSGGCGNKASSKVDVKSFEAAFSTAKPKVKAVADKGMSAIKSADYRGGFAELATLLKNEELSAEQKEALQTMLHQLSQLVPPRPAMSAVGPPPEK